MHLCRHASSVYLCTKVILHGYISLDNSSWPTTRATGKEILLHVVLYLARSWFISQEKWVDSEFACYINIIFVNVMLSHFYVFWTSKSQKNFPLGLCHGPAERLTATLRAPCALCTMHMFHAQLILAPPALQMLTFFRY